MIVGMMVPVIAHNTAIPATVATTKVRSATVAALSPRAMPGSSAFVPAETRMSTGPSSLAPTANSPASAAPATTVTTMASANTRFAAMLEPTKRIPYIAADRTDRRPPRHNGASAGRVASATAVAPTVSPIPNETPADRPECRAARAMGDAMSRSAATVTAAREGRPATCHADCATSETVRGAVYPIANASAASQCSSRRASSVRTTGFTCTTERMADGSSTPRPPSRNTPVDAPPSASCAAAIAMP